jgi:tRNA pseudouridine38-40 synthase
MRNVRLLIAYDGSAFFGWQRQEGFVSVQEAIEGALEAVVGERITVHGSGRTDAGVHALGQTASFHVDTRLDDDRLLRALNAHLMEGVVARDLETCGEEFHAQRSARGKRYGYAVSTARFRPPFGRTEMHWIPQPLDLDAMRLAAGHFVGEHDFTSLASAGSPRKSNVRRIVALHLLRRREGIALVVQGTGFLYNMVRTIAGTLFEVGRGRLAPDRIAEILQARDRSLAGPTAPAPGLYLLRVLYHEPVFTGSVRASQARRR